MKREVEGEIKHDAESGQPEKSNHIFQALQVRALLCCHELRTNHRTNHSTRQYLRKLCSHPCLVLDEHHPEYTQLTHEMQQANSHLHDIQHAPKLLALKYVPMWPSARRVLTFVRAGNCCTSAALA